MGLLATPSTRILGASGVAVSCAADTNENTLATITVPAGAMGTNGLLRIHTLWTVTSSANNKTLVIRFGGIAGTRFLWIIGTTFATMQTATYIFNRGAVNSQTGFTSGNSIGWGTSGGGNVTDTLDTTAARDIVITGQKASSGETLTLDAYLVELIRP